MDVVEAIDAWIDEEIDDLTDENLEAILEILDAVAASSLANVDADLIYDDDIAELVDLAGGSARDRSYSTAVLRAALLGETDAVSAIFDSAPTETEADSEALHPIDGYLERPDEDLDSESATDVNALHPNDGYLETPNDKLDANKADPNDLDDDEASSEALDPNDDDLDDDDLDEIILGPPTTDTEGDSEAIDPNDDDLDDDDLNDDDLDQIILGPPTNDTEGDSEAIDPNEDHLETPDDKLDANKANPDDLDDDEASSEALDPNDDDLDDDDLNDDDLDIILGPSTNEADGDSEAIDPNEDHLAARDDDFDELDEIALGSATDQITTGHVEVADLDDEPDTIDAAAEDGDDSHDGLLSDIAQADTIQLPIAADAAIRPVDLRAFDALGPSFLPEGSQKSNRNRRRSRRRLTDVLLPAFLIVGLAVFGFGMLQLINSLNEEDSSADVATYAEAPTATATPEPTAEPTEPSAAAATTDPAAPPPTPTPEPTPPPRIGIRLVTGDIVLASFPEAESPPEITEVYDASDEDLAPASQLTWFDDDLGIVDSIGNVLIIDPDAQRPQPTLIYEVGGGLGAAVKVASVDDQVVVLTEDGNISLIPRDGRADPDVLQVVWDATEEGARATDLTAIETLIPFVLETGDARMILTDGDNAILPIWSAEEQPQAFNVGGSSAGILLGVGQGAVARYNLDAGEDDPVLASVWDPFSREDAPAIGYSSVGGDTAIVTGDGAIVLSDGEGGGPVLWDPEQTEIRAFTALGDDTGVVVLLETGSVVQVPLDTDALIQSVWDITDETLSPANQITLETFAG